MTRPELIDTGSSRAARSVSHAVSAAGAALVLLLALVPSHGAAQTGGAQAGAAPTEGEPRNVATRGTATVTPRAAYDAGGLWRTLLGDNWRDLWTSEITVPVLDLQRFAGGITPFKSGGNQSYTLHFNGVDGRRYVFRSVIKDVERILGPDLENTFIGGIVQDQTSANQPSASTIADVLQNAAGILHPWPQLVVMPDDPSLGEYRERFAGMLGHIEIKPDDVEEGVTPFAGGDKYQGTDKMVQNLEESLEYRFDSRAFLKARLMDAMLGDFDRGADQWDWVRYDEGGVKTYRPIARDRDWAFMRADGSLMKLVRRYYAKIGSYDNTNDRLRSIMFMTREFDRSRLSAVPWAEWQQVVTELQTSLTDDVIARAVRAQPEPFPEESAEIIARGFRARRDLLPDLARDFYMIVNKHADVFAADGNEVADIERRADGTVHIRITRLKKDGTLAVDEGPAFDRSFDPADTEEVRVYMLEGDDRVVVRGSGPGDIKLRIVGGGGSDFLADSASVSRGDRTQFYDASGNNTFIRADGTDLHTGTFVTQQPGRLEEPDADDDPIPVPTVLEERPGRFQDQYHPEGADFFTQKTQNRSPRYWGATASMRPTIDLRDGAGVVIGAGATRTSYGFRSAPYASHVGARVLYGVDAGSGALQLFGDWRPPMSSLALQFDVLASGIESQRFYGFGNASQLLPQDSSLILRNELRIEPTIRWFFGDNTSLHAGPVGRFVDAREANGIRAAGLPDAAFDSYGAVGGRIGLTHDRVRNPSEGGSGYRASAEAATFRGIDDGDESFSRATGEVAAFIPLRWPTLALRAGGEHAWGSVPLHEAPQIGGRQTLRGFRWNRFAGDAVAFGNAELRVPITRAEFLVRGDLGLILFADAGRAWVDGESAGGWHTSNGVGISFAALSNAVSVLYARGEENRVYLNLGFPF